MSEIYNKFNSLGDQQRFDLWNVIQADVESYSRRGTRRDHDPVVCVKVDANWEWGVSGAGRPHRNLYLIGHLYKKPEEDYLMSFMPIPKGGSHGKYGATGIQPDHMLVIENEQAFETLIQEKIDELEAKEAKQREDLLAQYEEGLRIVKEKGYDPEDYYTFVTTTEVGQMFHQAKAGVERDNDPSPHWIPKFLEAAKNAPMVESINVKRWGKLAGLIKG